MGLTGRLRVCGFRADWRAQLAALIPTFSGCAACARGALCVCCGVPASLIFEICGEPASVHFVSCSSRSWAVAGIRWSLSLLIGGSSVAWRLCLLLLGLIHCLPASLKNNSFRQHGSARISAVDAGLLLLRPLAVGMPALHLDWDYDWAGAG